MNVITMTMPTNEVFTARAADEAGLFLAIVKVLLAEMVEAGMDEEEAEEELTCCGYGDLEGLIDFYECEIGAVVVMSVED